MKHFYSTPVGAFHAVVDLTMLDEATWEINRINVPRTSRGLGHGSVLLDQVLADADDEGIDLVLHVYPSGGLDFEQLADWYQRNGFEWAEPNLEDKAMRRQAGVYCGLCDGGHVTRNCPAMPRIQRAEANA